MLATPVINAELSPTVSLSILGALGQTPFARPTIYCLTYVAGLFFKSEKGGSSKSPSRWLRAAQCLLVMHQPWPGGSRQGRAHGETQTPPHPAGHFVLLRRVSLF